MGVQYAGSFGAVSILQGTAKAGAKAEMDDILVRRCRSRLVKVLCFLEVTDRFI